MQASQSQPTDKTFVDELAAMIPQMRAFARGLCRNKDLADDIVQDACLKAWAARDRFIPGAPMRPWLFRIIRNLHTGHQRKAWRVSSLAPEEAETTLTTPGTQEWTCDFQVMQSALRHLPEKQREALITVLAAGFSYEEAAGIIGCSEGTVKSRVSRGREALVALMTKTSANTPEGRLKLDASPENPLEELLAMHLSGALPAETEAPARAA